MIRAGERSDLAQVSPFSPIPPAGAGENPGGRVCQVAKPDGLCEREESAGKAGSPSGVTRRPPSAVLLRTMRGLAGTRSWLPGS
jgi:hypothetical protein